MCSTVEKVVRSASRSPMTRQAEPAKRRRTPTRVRAWQRSSCRKEQRHMLNLNSVMIGTKQPQELAAFYEKVIGKPADMVEREQGFWGWQVGSAFLGILEHSKMEGQAKDPG